MSAAKVIERTTLRHFPSEIVGDGFSEALKIRHFLGGHTLRPLKFGAPSTLDTFFVFIQFKIACYAPKGKGISSCDFEKSKRHFNACRKT